MTVFRRYQARGTAVEVSIRAIIAACSISLLLFALTPVVNAEEHSQNQRTANTPIEHVIVLMQENHSFDNYFGTYPGANGIPLGTCMPLDPFELTITECVEPFHLGDNDVEFDDPDHSSETHEIQFNGGLMTGFVYALNLRNQDGRLAMGYYDDRDLPYYWNIADEYVLFDNFFSSVHGGSFDNHMFWVAAAVGEVDSGNDEIVTIFDRLEAAGISWKFYIQNYDPGMTYRTVHLYPSNRASQVIWAPLLNINRFIDDPTLNSRIVNLDEYYDDLIEGTLPHVAFMVPSGPSEHPPSNVRSGQRFVRILIQSLMQSEYWNRSAFMWTYDDWGGWYDHVPPPQVDEYGYGMRVPTLLVSPYAKRGHVDSSQLDYTSFLKFIEDNWGLEPLGERDANANSIVSAFDFVQPPRLAWFLPFERTVEDTQAEPRRIVIYTVYGSAILIASGFVAAAASRRVPSRQRRITPLRSGRAYVHRPPRIAEPRATRESRHRPTDLTDEEWAALEPLIPQLTNRDTKHDRREIANGLAYVLRTGSAWTAIPKDLPRWPTVFFYAWQWRKSKNWALIEAQLRGSAGMDAQSKQTGIENSSS